MTVGLGSKRQPTFQTRLLLDRSAACHRDLEIGREVSGRHPGTLAMPGGGRAGWWSKVTLESGPAFISM